MILKKIKCFIRELNAKIKGKSFYCEALSGNSEYNICINSDMTVSCNCQDWDGSGHIGDLSQQNLQEIFSGEKAIAMRVSLSKGILPIKTCLACRELKEVNKTDSHIYITNYSAPRKGIMIENTVNCNLNCKYCNRELVESVRKKKKLSLKDVEKISEEIKKNDIKIVYFFNLGEPFLSNNINDELKILKESNPNLKIIISTNGFLLDSQEKREAVIKYVDHIHFSIDGVDDKTLLKYQRKGSFDKVYDNMKLLVENRNEKKSTFPVIEWKYVVFNWNDTSNDINKAIELAREAKINTITFCRGGGPFWAISWKYRLGFFNNIGRKSWKGRELNL